MSKLAFAQLAHGLLLSSAISLGGCTEIRSVRELNATSSGPVSSGTGTSWFSTRLPRGSLSVPVSSSGSTTGFVSLGCANPTIYNFCFSVVSTTGSLVREVGDLPKVTLAAGGYTLVSAMAFLPPNDVILVGNTTGNLGEIQGGAGDGFVARYSLNGQRIWLKQFGQNTLGADNSNQREDFLDVAVDLTGNSYVVGRTRSHFGFTNQGNYDAFLLKLDANGNEVWKKLQGSVNDEEYRKVMITGQGQIIVGGQTCGNLFETNAGLTTEAGYNASLACPTANFRDVVVSAYLADGTNVYNRQLGGVSLTSGKGRGSDVLFDMAFGSSGEVFLTGMTTSSYGKSTDTVVNGATHAGMGDLFVAKLSSAGVLQWSRMWGSALSGSPKVEMGRKILALNDTSELLVCAETFGNFLETQGGGAVSGGDSVQGPGDLVMIRLGQSGTLVGQTQVGNESYGASRTSAKETCGSLVRTGSQFTLFGTSDGNLLSAGSGNFFMLRGPLSAFTEFP